MIKSASVSVMPSAPFWGSAYPNSLVLAVFRFFLWRGATFSERLNISIVGKKKQQAKTYGESPTLLFRSPNLGHFKKKNTNMVKFADDKYSQHMLI